MIDEESGLEYEEVLSLAEKQKIQNEKVKHIMDYLKKDDGTPSLLLEPGEHGTVLKNYTHYRVAAFLKLYAELGSVAQSAQYCGIPKNIVKIAERNPKLKEEIQHAKALFEGKIIEEMVRRGVHGVEEPVYFKDSKIGTKMVYSDRLLEKLAESNIKSYSRKNEAENLGLVVKLKLSDGTEVDVGAMSQVDNG